MFPPGMPRRNQPKETTMMNDRAYILSLYQTLLGRAADEGGAAHWIELLNRGASRHDVLVGFVQSDEYRKHYPATAHFA